MSTNPKFQVGDFVRPTKQALEVWKILFGKKDVGIVIENENMYPKAFKILWLNKRSFSSDIYLVDNFELVCYDKNKLTKKGDY